jgi:hypothetical protein
MRKTFFGTIDTETTIDGKIVDFALVITDKSGKVYFTYAAMVKEFYFDRENHALFYMPENAFWAKKRLPARYAAYDAMIANGQRIVATIPAINRMLAEVMAKYNPVWTAYNWNYDFGKMRSSGVHVELMANNFCLWHAAAHKYVKNKQFRQFILEGHYFNARTKHGNMTFQTNADVMAKFILNDSDLADEPHTAFEDAMYYEIPILTDIVKTKNKSDYMEAPAYAWQGVQVRDWFKPK